VSRQASRRTKKRAHSSQSLKDIGCWEKKRVHGMTDEARTARNPRIFENARTCGRGSGASHIRGDQGGFELLQKGLQPGLRIEREPALVSREEPERGGCQPTEKGLERQTTKTEEVLLKVAGKKTERQAESHTPYLENKVFQGHRKGAMEKKERKHAQN